MAKEDKTKTGDQAAVVIAGQPGDPVKPIEGAGEVKPKVDDSSAVAKPVVDPVPPEDDDMLNKLVEKKRLKKVGKLFVDVKFDPTLTEEYKTLRDEHLSKLNTSQAEMDKLKNQLDEVSKKLSSKEELETAERQNLQTSLEEVKVQLAAREKEFMLANVKLLRTQEAVAQGLPFAYLDYVKGETPDEIKNSVLKVLGDFNVNKEKITKEELDRQVREAAERAKKETEEALKTRGKPTEGGGVEGHIYTRGEINDMSIQEYQLKRAIIQKQIEEGLIK